MEYFFFVFKSAFIDFSRNKMRTLLTSLGILIGVLSVILLVSLGRGLQNYIEQEFDKLGSNTIYVAPGKLLGDNGALRPAATEEVVGLSFDEQDFARLKRVKSIKSIAPLLTSGGNVSHKSEKEYGTIIYSNEEIFPAQNLVVQYGNAFTQHDVLKRSKVVVIGSKIAEKLFPKPFQAVGKTVKINNHSFKVVGVIEKKGSGGLGGPDMDSYIVIPYKTGFLITGDRKFINFVIQPKSKDVVAKTITDVKKTMLDRYDEDEFSVVEMTDILNAVTNIFSIIEQVLVAIAAISLIVGGIGIMNIMYVTVTERIREIGIRRAIGARKFDILSQFIMESVLLSLIGGLMAVGLAFIIVHFLQKIFPAIITIDIVLLALGTSSAIGVIFGVFPAMKAANLSPIDAIRYE